MNMSSQFDYSRGGFRFTKGFKISDGIRFDEVTVFVPSIRTGRPEKTVSTQIRRRRTRRLIRVYTVYHPFGTFRHKHRENNELVEILGGAR